MTGQDGFRLGVKIRVYNYNLKTAIERSGKTSKQVAAECGISYGTLAAYQSFKQHPALETQVRICSCLGVTLEDVFPIELANIRLTRQPEAISFSRDEAIAAGMLSGGAPPDELAERVALTEILRQTLRTIAPREAQVLRLRFGLEGEVSHTLEEIAPKMGVTRERVRQIEQKGLRKLRHPSRAKEFRDFDVTWTASASASSTWNNKEGV